MITFDFFKKGNSPKILCLGAHPDDIEIGCGATILKIINTFPYAHFYWVVFSGNEQRQKEADNSADSFLGECKVTKILKQFRESYFPFIGAEIKDFFEEIRHDFYPDIILTHYLNDAHQDHRLISNLTWNTFRDNFILQYEVPKYDGDLSNPNLYVEIDEPLVKAKISKIMTSFSSQNAKSWFTEETFRSILRLRGIESNSKSGYSEAFHCKKIIF